MEHDVSPFTQGRIVIRCQESVIDYHQYTVFLCQFIQWIKGNFYHRRISHRLNEECPCIIVHFLLDFDNIFEINILEFDSVLGFIKIKYPECPSVQVETDQYFITGSEKIAYQLYGSHTAGCC